ncbi:carboxypeptidase-like regulatory domain-containing protein [Ferruginibacter lapsinanis]|uniref:carboxypeptidase-like regulatory domain-containing protein n=1 Tax=Ferruginibacter lapsinanis TaxID=563172 RepID=UPI001E38CEF1|nr:carboxypeptidase-like regulatory domain-containing protein [Ferruginibacter lapsinanis]UEG50984.1 carboxypeptidase-like regulatory domain-containing protein [Ferruginibacter lapsinanis]
MKYTATKNTAKLTHVFLLLAITMFSCSKSFATIGLTVNGQANGATFETGNTFSWSISGLTTGAGVSNQLWIDMNGNDIIDPATDFLFVSFNQTDGVPGGNQGPGDDDATANGTITTSIGGLGFPVGNYIFRTISGTDTATSTYSLTAISSPTFTVSGKVTKDGSGLINVVVSLQGPDGEYYVLTDNNGNYIITTKEASGSNVRVRVPMESFNSSLSGYVFTPNEASFTLSSNVSNIDFTVLAGKIIMGTVTDTTGAPIFDMAVNVYTPNGGGNKNYDGRTDVNGNYSITVDTGTYTVQFGNDREPKGYLRTYYNQKYSSQNADYIHVTEFTDTIKNINAVLRKGAVIMGTFKKDGKNIRGGINAYAYNVPGPPLYEAYHDSTENFYYLFVPPGQYSIQFHVDNGGGGGPSLFFNQTPNFPGSMVNINALSDTAKNINVDFTSPLTYMFIGNGNWGNPFNWKDNLRPPFTLYPPDTILISHVLGGQCILNYTQHISNGASLVVPTGKTLVVPGSLTIQ